MIPTTSPAVVAALYAAFDGLDGDAADGLATAMLNAADPMKIADGFDALRGAATLPDKALIALVGAARLLIQHNFNGLALVAHDELTRRAAAIAALPAPPSPYGDLPPPLPEPGA